MEHHISPYSPVYAVCNYGGVCFLGGAIIVNMSLYELFTAPAGMVSKVLISMI